MEATELIYLTMHQERYEDLKQRILLTYGAKYDKEQEQEFSARMDFLTQLQEDTEALLDFQEPRLRYFFERHATGGSGHCCLATVLVSSFNDIRQEDLQQAAQAMEERWRLLSGPGFEISEISYSGLMELPSLVPMEEASSGGRELIRWYNLTPEGNEVEKLYTFHNYADRWYVLV